MTAYLAHVAERGSKRTLINVGVALQLFADFLGDGDLTKVSVSSLSRTALDGFYRHLRTTPGRHGRVRSLDSSAKYVSIVQVWWRWMANQDAWAGVVPPPRHLDALPRDARQKTRAPTWEEMDAAIAAAGAWYPLAMAVMRALGLRVSQALRLLVGDIRVERDVVELHFRGELGKSHQERSGRIVPIAPSMLPLFAGLTEGRAPDAWLIPTRRAKGAREREVRTEKVRAAWERSGVRAEVWSRRPDHAFRKGFFTSLRERGAMVEAVKYLVGHSLGLTGIYTDERGLALRDAVAKVPTFHADAWASIKQALSTEMTNE